jgi:glycosyltransferase involved in cell wall biosynthesis
MVLESEFPPDERVEKEIESLLHIGISVSIAVYTFSGRPSKEVYKGYTIYRKPISKYLYKSSAAILLLPCYSIFWYRFLNTLLKREKYDCLHIHDLPLSRVGHHLARRYKLKLVCDQHEYYSNWIVRTRHYNTFMGRIIRYFSNWTKFERKYLQKADLVITVEDSLRQIYLDKVKIVADRIITLPNTPRGQIFHAGNLNPEIVARYRDDFMLFYAGSLDHLRGIDFVAACMAHLKDEISNIKFLIAGKENRAFHLQKIISEYHLEQVVEFVGWIPLDLLPSYVAASRVCVFVPRADNLEINNTIATKIYQYAAMGKPVIVSEARMMKEFVESNRIGYSVRYGDITGFCAIVRKLHNHPEIAEEIRSRAVVVASHYTWENTSRDFIGYYTNLKKEKC